MSDLEKKVELLASIALCDDNAQKQEFLKALRSLHKNTVVQSVMCPEDRESFVSSMLSDLGIPTSILGYHYLVSAIILIVEQPKVRHSIVGEVYVRVAKAHRTTSARVERCIRTAVLRSAEVSSDETMYKYFSNTVHPSRGYPTNSEFMCALADIVIRNENK